MTVSNQLSSITTVGNGVTKAFPYDFTIPTADEARVSLYDTLTFTSTVLDPSMYSITGIGGSSGTVTYPLSGAAIPSTQALTIDRVVPFTQDLALTNQSDFFPEVLETQLDTIVYMVQQLDNENARSLKLPLGSTLDPDAYVASLNSAMTAASDAEASANAAASSQTAAASSAAAAAASASSASTSASTATTKATAAANSATSASTSATNAGNDASAAHTDRLAADADAASTASDRTAAAASASDANTSASNAAVSATDAANSAAAAAASATSASGSASTATTKATAAANSATAAASSAASASGSATAATNEATAAHNDRLAADADVVLTHADVTSADNSKTAAAASASAAATSATNAATSETNAANSAAAAAASAGSMTTVAQQTDAAMETALVSGDESIWRQASSGNSIKRSFANLAAQISSAIASAFATAAQGAKADAALPASSYTASDVLTKLKTVDGSGSGLDADTLDTHDSSYFQTALGYTAADAAGQTFTGTINTSGAGQVHELGQRVYSPNNNPAFSAIASKPTTLSGYGITDGAPVPTSSTLPVGWSGVMILGTGSGTIANGSTVAGSYLQIKAGGQAASQTGTWKNIFGVSLVAGDIGLFVRIA